MRLLDIRTLRYNEVKFIRFADHDSGGLGKLCDLRNVGPAQVDVVAQGGSSLHVRYDDIDNFIAALKKAKELWNK